MESHVFEVCLIFPYPKISKIYVILMTATTSKSDLPDGFWRMGTGADDFLTKPFEPAAVINAIEEIRLKEVKARKSSRDPTRSGYY